MNNVLSFDNWKRVNEQVNNSKAPVSSSNQKAPIKGGSSTGTTNKPMNTTKPTTRPANTTKPTTRPTNTTKPAPKPLPMKGGSSTGTTTRPTNVTRPTSVPNYSSIAIQISDKISALFRNPSFWAQYKGTFNDDEDAALNAFNNWWRTSITPMLAKLPSTDVNTQTIIRIQPSIQQALLGSSTSDTVSWSISGAQGMSKAYQVDTDF